MKVLKVKFQKGESEKAWVQKSESAVKDLEEKEGLARRGRLGDDVATSEEIAVKIRLKDASHGWSNYEVI